MVYWSPLESKLSREGNRFAFHRYAMQPWLNVRPGISMGPFGLHDERTQTRVEQSQAWHEYPARCLFLLQQGLFVADTRTVVPVNLVL